MRAREGREVWPADQVERWPIDRLIPYAKPRIATHSEAQIAQLAASMKKWGWTNPMLADEAGGVTFLRCSDWPPFSDLGRVRRGEQDEKRASIRVRRVSPDAWPVDRPALDLICRPHGLTLARALCARPRRRDCRNLLLVSSRHTGRQRRGAF
jgi:hypothetical protein